jgi:hypothetical protein
MVGWQKAGITFMLGVHMALLAMLGASAQAGYGTTVIVKLENGRVLVAADERVQLRSTEAHQVTNEDKSCKIHQIGASTFSEIGNAEYYQMKNGVKVTHWNAQVDLREAFQGVGDDVPTLAHAWGVTTRNHIANRLGMDGIRPGDIAQGPRGLVAGGVFVGWRGRLPVVKVSRLFVAGNELVEREDDLRIDLSMGSNNLHTEELTDGKTERAVAAAKRWKVESLRYPESERSWRYLGFLVRETSKIDETVSPKSDIIELLPTGQLVWLQRSACAP